MRHIPYFKRAAKRFLNGTRFRTPCDAVEAGTRTLETWCRMLAEEHEVERERSAHPSRKQHAACGPDSRPDAHIHPEIHTFTLK